ncbi:peroxide stress protein YaaA [Asticcacaulis sp. AND118]|uniref:peroxide stress protein YaaA n=1 Tax=Asticcacaulis sp. AND118 TaxID=2840468 RepID=UPI001CFF76C1|nr:peroxide stress protein YaaA [Asticcacaulis sp. AND118]UDF02194.1 peroxide stress protein YaaA [Asticcacaulis sp. AND118]
MILLLSPAKSLDETPVTPPLATSEPRFARETHSLLKVMKTQKPADLQRLMDISAKLGELNHHRYKGFADQPALPAALMFDGDVYTGLRARDLDAEGLAFAQDHVRILSGLYGLLRPLDLIRPYRLEMGTGLATAKGANLYAFWGDRIAKAIVADAGAVGTKTVLNLASQEYARAALTKALRLKVIEVKFLEIKEDKTSMISFFAKKARGLMARYVIDNRITDADKAKAFDSEGYRFVPEHSTDTVWTFSRKHPTA